MATEVVPTPAVSVQGLGKSFGALDAVKDLSLEVADQTIVGLVGPDGAGKTTTMRMLAGILPADAGSMTVAGVDVVRRPEAVKPLLGYLPQTFSLHRDLTVAENLRYRADLYLLPRREWPERARKLLEITDLARFQDRLAMQLSGGMKQKLALICALLHRPQVLLLDEPTTGVDPVSRRDFWRLLYRLPREGTSLLLSTPYMDEAARCNRVAFLYQGRLLREGTPQDLRQAVAEQIVEFRCQPQQQGREMLKVEQGVRSVEVFGDRLHVVLREGTTWNAVEPRLRAAGVACHEVREVVPSLEDVFVALSTGGVGNGEEGTEHGRS
jgi:ABC-2 type transport system ATP-binding protein